MYEETVEKAKRLFLDIETPTEGTFVSKEALDIL
jgi:hypothetical protein